MMFNEVETTAYGFENSLLKIRQTFLAVFGALKLN